jgi:hypothetical protein
VNVQEELIRCKEWIQSALDKGGNTHDFIDVVEGVLKGSMQLWSGEKGCAVTEIVVYPKKKVLHVFLAGGKLEQITDMHADAVKWAKTQGCQGMTIAGRPGWKKILDKYGWKEQLVILGKEF